MTNSSPEDVSKAIKRVLNSIEQEPITDGLATNVREFIVNTLRQYDVFPKDTIDLTVSIHMRESSDKVNKNVLRINPSNQYTEELLMSLGIYEGVRAK